jgi:hypothetical protein
VDECPFEWACVQHGPSLPDVVFVCIPAYSVLCRPCLTNGECMVEGSDAGLDCVSFGEKGAFCTYSCQASADCPDNGLCGPGESVTGSKGQYCIGLEPDECGCNGWFADQAASTGCYRENEAGKCAGERLCSAGGLSDCSAAVPAAEGCNGKDDDCDGTVDEDAGAEDCLVTSPFGACPGVSECTNGKSVCIGPEPKKELCDGADNDCDGSTDEGFPDTDDDGEADCLEADKDGDGLSDVLDNCPAVTNPKQDDADLDTIGDACDPDDDNDKVADDQDCAPLDDSTHPGATEVCDGKDNDCNYVVDEGYPDTDTDGWKNCIDDDDDDDGVPDGSDNCALAPNPGQEDINENGIGDTCEKDLDQDGTPNEQDCAPLDPLVFPGAVEVCNGQDDDCDFVADDGFPDFDKDGAKDCLDDDDDDDQDPDLTDCQPLNPTAGHGLAEACDGLDNNCDGEVDEGFGTTTCGLGKCKHTIKNCFGGVLVMCNPFDGAAAETCDGLDNDCDGIADEDLGTLQCGVGQCLHTVPACQQGKPGACDPMQGASEELCDAKDNDCNGQTDEGLGKTTCGLGQCEHAVDNCIKGIPQMCNPFVGGGKEACDLVDNDCDGMVDEDLGAMPCGIGTCYHLVPHCIDGVPGECDPKEGAKPEACDGLDNDCDGAVDEDLGTTSCGKGICAHPEDNCVGGKPVLCNPFEGAQAEVCDGLDNDCDGLTDEDMGSVTCGQGVCQHSVLLCENGVPKQCDPFLGKTDETCDGKDNDCDGAVDEDLGMTTCGLGSCLHTVDNCSNGQPKQCDPLEGASPEICDGKDNDCDGKTDPVDAAGCKTFYADADNDKYGAGAGSCLCNAVPPYVTNDAGDCADNDPLRYPFPHAICGIDADCVNGLLDIGEECDDGNAKDGDGCSSACKLEPPKVFTQVIHNGAYGGYNQEVLKLGTIPALAGLKIKITRVGLCGDADASSGPKRFAIQGGGLDFSWAAGQTTCTATHWLGYTTPTQDPNRGFVYATVSYTAQVNQPLDLYITNNQDWDGHHCQDTDAYGTSFNDSGVGGSCCSVRGWVEYQYVP